MEFNLPFEMRDALPNIYEHWVAKDLFAYLHLARNQLSRKEFLQVMNRPKRYLSRDSIDAPIVSFETLRTYYEDKDWMMDRIDRMEIDFQILRGLAPYAAVNYIRYGINYEEYLTEYAKERRMKPEELLEILDEIQQSAKPFKTMEEWEAHLKEYRQHLEDQRGKKSMIQMRSYSLPFTVPRGWSLRKYFSSTSMRGSFHTKRRIWTQILRKNADCSTLE